MNLFSLIYLLIHRLYAWSIRSVEKWLKSKEPPNAYLTLLILTSYAVYNCATDSLTNHLVVISSTYYANSTIYDPNTLVILFNTADQIRQRRALLCQSQSSTSPGESRSDYAKVFFAYAPVGVCKWTAYIARCSVAPNPRRVALTHGPPRRRRDTHEVELPLRVPYQPKGGTPHGKRRLSVASCFSPLFFNERWQLVVTTLEIYRHYGVQLQVFYVQSAVEALMRLLEIYQRRGLAALEPWASLELGEENEGEIGFDPNAELDWRNQASAHTDCLLKYKEAADFIIVGDVDDVLIPKLSATYIGEFLTLATAYPIAAGFTYTRYNTELESAAEPPRFSLRQVITSARIDAGEREDGKYVVNTSRVETAWLHYPGRVAYGMEMFTVPEEVNIMVHLRNWTINTPYNRLRKRRFTKKEKEAEVNDRANPRGSSTQIADLISEQALAEMEAHFSQLVLSSHTNNSTFNSLPTTSRYLPLIVACYDKMFYSQPSRRPTSCPGPLKCAIPPLAGLRCSVAERPYRRHSVNWRTQLYVPSTSGQFTLHADGCRW